MKGGRPTRRENIILQFKTIQGMKDGRPIREREKTFYYNTKQYKA